MKLSFHGAAQTVTGSMHLVEVNGSRILLDCGMYQGRRKESYEKNHNFSFDVNTIDAVILSHAHIDHSGNLPNLVKQGFHGPIYATRATAHLTDLMLRDSGHIQEKQAASINFHNKKKRGEPLAVPLYTEEDAKLVKPLLHDLDYEEEFEAAPGAMASLHDAGHILGSASVELNLEEKMKKTKLWFSGDIGRRDLPIIRDPVLPRQADVLIMESTYGDKPHRAPEEAYIEMRDVIQRTLDRKGKVIIPSFAVGRTQEIVYNLSRMYDAGELPAVPVYVDSPLAVNASNIFRNHNECYDKNMNDLIKSGHPALDFKLLTYVSDVEESKELNERKDPMIIISAAGMAETGRVVYHIRWAIENKRNTIMIVSWQAPETLGRRIADRDKKVKIFGEEYKLKAEVATINGLSSHAGQDLLIEYAAGVKKSAQNIFLVHGEERGALPLMEKLKENRVKHVHYPAMRTVVDL